VNKGYNEYIATTYLFFETFIVCDDRKYYRTDGQLVLDVGPFTKAIEVNMVMVMARQKR